MSLWMSEWIWEASTDNKCEFPFIQTLESPVQQESHKVVYAFIDFNPQIIELPAYTQLYWLQSHVREEFSRDSTLDETATLTGK